MAWLSSVVMEAGSILVVIRHIFSDVHQKGKVAKLGLPMTYVMSCRLVGSSTSFLFTNVSGVRSQKFCQSTHFCPCGKGSLCATCRQHRIYHGTMAWLPIRWKAYLRFTYHPKETADLDQDWTCDKTHWPSVLTAMPSELIKALVVVDSADVIPWILNIQW